MREMTATRNGGPSRWLTQQAAADYVGCCVRQVQLLSQQGKLPVSYALGPRSPRYDRLAIDAALAAECEAVETNGAK